MFGVVVSEDGRYVVVTVHKDCDVKNKLWIYDLEKTNYQIVENFDFVKIVDEFEAEFE